MDRNQPRINLIVNLVLAVASFILLISIFSHALDVMYADGGGSFLSLFYVIAGITALISLLIPSRFLGVRVLTFGPIALLLAITFSIASGFAFSFVDKTDEFLIYFLCTAIVVLLIVPNLIFSLRYFVNQHEFRLAWKQVLIALGAGMLAGLVFHASFSFIGDIGIYLKWFVAFAMSLMTAMLIIRERTQIA